MIEKGTSGYAFTLFGDREKGEIEVDCIYILPGNERPRCELNGNACQFAMLKSSKVVPTPEIKSFPNMHTAASKGAIGVISSHLPLVFVAIWFIFLNFLDVMTTSYGLNSGSLVETNPLFQTLSLNGLAVFYKVAIVVASLFIIFQTYRVSEKMYIWVSAFTLGVVHVVVLSNIYLILL